MDFYRLNYPRSFYFKLITIYLIISMFTTQQRSKNKYAWLIDFYWAVKKNLAISYCPHAPLPPVGSHSQRILESHGRLGEQRATEMSSI